MRKKNFYGVTNKRIIIQYNQPGKKVRFVDIDSKLKIDFLPHLDNTATIDLGIKVQWSTSPTIWTPAIDGYNSLYRLGDGAFVHKIIREMIEEIKKKEISSGDKN